VGNGLPCGKKLETAGLRREIIRKFGKKIMKKISFKRQRIFLKRQRIFLKISSRQAVV
jgi:hypothetical protein